MRQQDDAAAAQLWTVFTPLLPQLLSCCCCFVFSQRSEQCPLSAWTSDLPQQRKFKTMSLLGYSPVNAGVTERSKDQEGHCCGERVGVTTDQGDRRELMLHVRNTSVLNQRHGPRVSIPSRSSGPCPLMVRSRIVERNPAVESVSGHMDHQQDMICRGEFQLGTRLGDRISLILDTARTTSLLDRMFGSEQYNELTWPNEKVIDDITDDISSTVFRAILNSQSSGIIHFPDGPCPPELQKTLQRFCIHINHSNVGNLGSLMHKELNQGARRQFERYLEEMVLPLMVASAQSGERECHVVVLMDHDVVDLEECAPPMAEENLQILHSTKLYQFFKFMENRVVAKSVLKERGLKKIRLGVEGYPTCKEKIQCGPEGGPGMVYTCVQRPFIRVSWEKEEEKSHHGDFQCAQSKSETRTRNDQLLVLELPVEQLGSLQSLVITPHQQVVLEMCQDSSDDAQPECTAQDHIIQDEEQNHV